MQLKHRLESGAAPAELQKRAAQEIRESEPVRQEALDRLRALVDADDSLDCSTEDEYLLRFLRPTHFYPDSAHQMIKDYFEHMKKHADVYSDIGPSQQSAILDNNLLAVSPVRDQCGRRVTVMRFGAWNSKAGTMDDLYRATVQCAELGASEPATQMMGSVAILDMKGTGLKHIANLTPSYAKKTVDMLQGNFPMRFKAFHVVNQPRLFDVVFAFFKPFLNSKLKSRIHFHGSDLKSLHNHVTPECLTKDYKGQLENFDQDGLIDMLHENEHIFKGIRNYAFENQK